MGLLRLLRARLFVAKSLRLAFVINSTDADRNEFFS